MGICGSAQEKKPEEKRNEEVHSILVKGAMKNKEINKLLLLGPGESGKSTLFKQMITLYGKGFSDTEKIKYITLVHAHILNSIKTLCQQSDSLQEKGIKNTVVELKHRQSKDIIERLQTVEDERLDPALAPHIRALWEDSGIQITYQHQSMYYLTDSASYFLNKIEDILSERYVPTEQDIFRCRTRSTGVLEEEFNIEGNLFHLVDVGGQRNERKKWIHCFSGVTSLLFVVALSEYDLVLFEDGKTNRMAEALSVFEDVANNQHLKKIPVMLFLNKRDLFAEKIEKKIPITLAFPDYRGANTIEACTEYINNQFLIRNKNPARKIYTLVTCATDTENVRFVFKTVNDIILKQSLAEGGLV